MKKAISICVVIMMLLTMLPVNVFAYDDKALTHNELISLACDVFPEYADAITWHNVNPYTLPRSVDPYEVIYRETRQISDNESLNISLLSSGGAILIYSSTGDITYTASTTDINSIGVAGTATFTVAFSDYSFVLSNVSFTIYEYADDYFTNRGNPQQSNFYRVSNKINTNTHIRYQLNVTASKFFTFDLAFENNQLVAST